MVFLNIYACILETDHNVTNTEILNLALHESYFYTLYPETPKHFN